MNATFSYDTFGMKLSDMHMHLFIGVNPNPKHLIQNIQFRLIGKFVKGLNLRLSLVTHIL